MRLGPSGASNSLGGASQSPQVEAAMSSKANPSTPHQTPRRKRSNQKKVASKKPLHHHHHLLYSYSCFVFFFFQFITYYQRVPNHLSICIKASYFIEPQVSSSPFLLPSLSPSPRFCLNSWIDLPNVSRNLQDFPHMHIQPGFSNAVLLFILLVEKTLMLCFIHQHIFSFLTYH